MSVVGNGEDFTSTLDRLLRTWPEPLVYTTETQMLADVEVEISNLVFRIAHLAVDAEEANEAGVFGYSRPLWEDGKPGEIRAATATDLARVVWLRQELKDHVASLRQEIRHLKLIENQMSFKIGLDDV